MSIDPNKIAEAAGVTTAYARMLLNGTRQPSLRVALSIYDATGVQLGILRDQPKSVVERLRPAKAA